VLVLCSRVDNNGPLVRDEPPMNPTKVAEDPARGRALHRTAHTPGCRIARVGSCSAGWGQQAARLNGGVKRSPHRRAGMMEVDPEPVGDHACHRIFAGGLSGHCDTLTTPCRHIRELRVHPGGVPPPLRIPEARALPCFMSCNIPRCTARHAGRIWLITQRSLVQIQPPLP
jgi:hypothetical protein